MDPLVYGIDGIITRQESKPRRNKLVMAFEEIEKPLILNKTNIKRLARIFETADTSQWRGPVTLYVEQGVEYGGRVVGGLRIKPAEVKSEPVDAQANGFAKKEHITADGDFF